MKTFKRVAALLFVAAIFFYPFVWWFWFHLNSEYGIMALGRVDESRTIQTKTIVTVDTFGNKVSSEFIKTRYNRAAKILSEKSTKTKSYISTDPESWGHVITVLANGSGYVYVSAGSGNDSETFSIGLVTGKFDDSEMKLLPDWKIPHGFLRCDWNKQRAEQGVGRQPATAPRVGD